MTSKKILAAMALSFSLALSAAHGDDEAAKQAFSKAASLQSSRQHLQAAELFFNVYTANGPLSTLAVGRVAESLIGGGYPNAATYFYIKTLQGGNKTAIRRIVAYLPIMMDAVGGEVLRKYLVSNTSESDYDSRTKSHFYYFLGKDHLLKGDAARALTALSKVSGDISISAQAEYLKGTASSIVGKLDDATAAFARCRKMSGRYTSRIKALRKEYLDLEARCTAGLARVQYQKGEFDKSEETYDEISKGTFVWTDILFEQAWNSYAKKDYNRTLGKLVTYRSPSLSFWFNPETDVLRAQSFLALCHYDDVNKTVNEFNERYAGVGGRLKEVLLKYDNDLGALYGFAKVVFNRKLHTNDMLHRALNRFIRGPYFAALIEQERMTVQEAQQLRSYVRADAQGFPGFLSKVLDWRMRSVRLLGGAFVKNSLYDGYKDLLANLDKMSFIKLEMLKGSKTKLQAKGVMSEDEDGNLKRGSASVDRRDYQYFWSFNGEFWIDELGDYVFALESECGRNGS